jgi:thiol-disulfide isomerase/thioredoxin
MSSTTSKGFWIAVAILGAFGIARIVLDARAQPKVASPSGPESTAATASASASASEPDSESEADSGESTPSDILGKKAPDFQLKSVGGETFALADVKGKVVLLDFWAVWCGPCQESMPFFQKLQDQYGSKGLEVVGLHVDDRMPGTDEVLSFLEERGIHYPNLVSTAKVDDGFQVYAMPTSYLLDRNGIVRKVHVGFSPDTAPDIEKDVRELLGVTE